MRGRPNERIHDRINEDRNRHEGDMTGSRNLDFEMS